MSKRLITILVVVVVLLIVALIIARKQGVIGGTSAEEVEVSPVARVDIVETVIASGKVQPEVEVKISSEVSGEIIELPILEGDEVKKGDLLIKINPDIYLAAVNRTKAAMNSASSNLATTRAQFREAQKSYERSKKLYEQQVISDAEWDAAQRMYEVSQLTVESASYQLASAQASYREASDNLKRTTIYAPNDGTVSMLNSEIGERVVGTAQMAGTEIARIADLENMEVLVEVNENDIIRVEINDTALIEVDAYLDKDFKGVVTEIANSAQLQGVSADQVTNFEVKVRILQESYKDLVKAGEKSPFRPGMTASVEIITDRESNILAVPIEAVTTRTDTSTEAKSYRVRREKADEPETGGGESFEVVFVYNNGKADLRVVSTGIQDDENIQIVSGLEDGEEVISGPYSLVSKRLVNGEDVEATNTDELSEED
jgi:HlyD family secretion protein